MPMNYAKTAMLLVLLTCILVAFGAAVGGRAGLVIAFVAALVMNAASLWKSDKMVLRMFKAQEISENDAPQYYAIVRELAGRAGLPMPRVYIMHNPQPNAFATGRSPDSAAVCASTGILDLLTPRELAGVIAHELAHIKNRDTLTMAVAATIGGTISMVAQYLQFSMIFGGGSRNRSGALGWLGTVLAVIVAPIAAGLVQMAISRSREYQADRLGAMIVGNPLWLASALAKINVAARRVANPDAERVPAAAHMFIVNPLNGRGIDSLFSTHPNVENRIAELKALAREMGISDEGQVPGAAPGWQQNQDGPAVSDGGGRGGLGRPGPWG